MAYKTKTGEIMREPEYVVDDIIDFLEEVDTRRSRKALKDFRGFRWNILHVMDNLSQRNRQKLSRLLIEYSISIKQAYNN